MSSAHYFLCPDVPPKAKRTSLRYSFLTAGTSPLTRDRAPKLKRDNAIFHPGKKKTHYILLASPKGQLPGDANVTRASNQSQPQASLTRVECRLETEWITRNACFPASGSTVLQFNEDLLPLYNIVQTVLN